MGAAAARAGIGPATVAREGRRPTVMHTCLTSQEYSMVLRPVRDFPGLAIHRNASAAVTVNEVSGSAVRSTTSRCT